MPRGVQPELDLLDPQSNHEAIADGYEVLRQAVTLYGGRKRLALEVGKSIDYESKIANGLNRSDDRHAFFDWIFPLLSHPEAGALLIEHLCTVAGYERPERLPETFTETDEVKAWRRAAKRLGVLEETLLSEVAKDLGTDVASLRRPR